MKFEHPPVDFIAAIDHILCDSVRENDLFGFPVSIKLRLILTEAEIRVTILISALVVTSY